MVEEKIGPKKHFGEALEENVSDICTKKIRIDTTKNTTD
jgi:hypothetical protein